MDIGNCLQSGYITSVVLGSPAWREINIGELCQKGRNQFLASSKNGIGQTIPHVRNSNVDPPPPGEGVHKGKTT